MFKGYNLKLDKIVFESVFLNGRDNLLLKEAALRYQARNNFVNDNLQNAIKSIINVENGVIDASTLEQDWFPAERFDVFISHSHADKELAYALAWWLEKNLSLKVFVDSMVWKYAGDLLKEIDKRFCWNDDSECYSYEKRNISTAHVHMMLNCALMKMIDATECLMFLNTPESVVLSADIENNIVTSSCWIYDELMIANLIRKSNPARRQILQEKVAMDSKQGIPQFNYSVPVGDFQELDSKLLKKWMSCINLISEHPLDVLYSLK